MIKNEITIILGAGASHPYLFPLGPQLKENIIKRSLEPDQKSSDLLSQLNITRDTALRFGQKLRMSGATSIDAFLEHQPSFEEVGKFYIAFELISKEYPEVVFTAADNWYSYLFGEMMRGVGRGRPEDFGANRVRFITYNYERSLEFFFFTALKNHFEGIDDEKVVDTLRHLPIMHLHGQLGPLPHAAGLFPFRAYEPEPSLEAVQIAIDGIEIIHEVSDDGYNIFAAAQKWVKEAETVIILGFGYHPTSVNRLPALKEHKNVYGTLYGMTPAEVRNNVMKALPNLKLKSGSPPPDTLDALAFLRHTGLLWE